MRDCPRVQFLNKSDGIRQFAVDGWWPWVRVCRLGALWIGGIGSADDAWARRYAALGTSAVSRACIVWYSRISNPKAAAVSSGHGSVSSGRGTRLNSRWARSAAWSTSNRVRQRAGSLTLQSRASVGAASWLSPFGGVFGDPNAPLHYTTCHTTRVLTFPERRSEPAKLRAEVGETRKSLPVLR
jgi:hypothetical protein